MFIDPELARQIEAGPLIGRESSSSRALLLELGLEVAAAVIAGAVLYLIFKRR